MYCLDSYALWEMQYSNEKFSQFLTENFVITEWTLVEFYRTILREYDKATAEYWLQKLCPFSRKVEVETLIKAVLFQHENKKTNMSIFDCIGYSYAQAHDILFVTGDKEFKGRKGVLFIQK
jgi:predicted nucleic acid-binding protein